MVETPSKDFMMKLSGPSESHSLGSSRRNNVAQTRKRRTAVGAPMDNPHAISPGVRPSEKWELGKGKFSEEGSAICSRLSKCNRLPKVEADDVDVVASRL